MARTAPSGASDERTTAVWLVEVVFWDGSSEVVLRMTTANEDITVDADGDSTPETYTGAGDFLEWDSVTEDSDRRAQGVRFKLSGVDTTVMSTHLNNDFRGRRLRLWRAKLDPSTGQVDETYLYHRGVQLADYEIAEHVPEEGPATAVISTRSVSSLSEIQTTNAVRTNERSHNAMLARAGVTTGDTFFQHTPNLPGRIFWGTEAPDPALTGENDGGSAGTGGPTGGHQPELPNNPGWPSIP